MPQDVIPLFPLPNVVLFPGMMLPLHIFEDRYRQLMQDVLDSNASFGVQLCKEYNPATLQGTPFDVGTLADIVEYETLDDGRYNVLVVGVRRFRVVTYDSASKPYLQGEVEWLDDVKDGYVTKKLLNETIDLFHEALRLTHKILQKSYDPKPLPDDPCEISFFIAENLKGSLVLKQELLEMPSIKARLMFERETLRKMVKTLAVRTQIEEAFRNA